MRVLAQKEGKKDISKSVDNYLLDINTKLPVISGIFPIVLIEVLIIFIIYVSKRISAYYSA